MIKIYSKRPVTTEEVKEILVLAEQQETNEKYTDTTLSINGDYAKINVEIDAEGNITIL